ncbi:MAG TPA: dihydrofolate reductase [Nocardioides sp.]|uniref:dihydrofolate reductase n=1 Tax=Nocardioides sp. TaxID=35761 RepID=UPI002E37481A|nr:dihydrofolate reductase [Nocardioides sp.]HEX3930557.1 dihydrofolate reductase [Nocardioides sp.]
MGRRPGDARGHRDRAGRRLARRVHRPSRRPAGPIFDWYDAGGVELRFNLQHVFHVSEQSAAYLQHADVRCQPIGRRLFDLTDGWSGLPIVGDRVFVVTHRDDVAEWRSRYPEAPYTFCIDGVHDACRRAAEHARRRHRQRGRGRWPGRVGRVADELAIDIATVLLGRGRRLLGSSTDELVLDDPHVVIAGERVLHLRYRLR